jgi:hypothetical protein
VTRRGFDAGLVGLAVAFAARAVAGAPVLPVRAADLGAADGGVTALPGEVPCADARCAAAFFRVAGVASCVVPDVEAVGSEAGTVVGTTVPRVTARSVPRTGVDENFAIFNNGLELLLKVI